MQLIQQGETTAARRRVMFRLVDATDGLTPETTVDLTNAADITISKNGAAYANAGTAAGQRTEISGGDYYYEFTQAELDTVGVYLLKITDASSRTVVKEVQVVPWDPYAADWALATALAAVQTDVDAIQTATPALEVSGPHAMGTRTTDGAFTALSMSHAFDADITVTGTWNGATVTIQTCTNVTAETPVWTDYDDSTGPNPLTADGTVRVTGPVAGVRALLSDDGASTSLTATCTMRSPVG